MDQTEIYLHWAYVAVMFASAAAFYGMGKNRKGIPYYKYLIHIFIVGWSGLVYAALALRQGEVEVAGRTVYYARYIDWTITTPLLLLSLALTGKLATRMEGWIIGGLMGTQAIMILSGLVAELSVTPTQQYFWFTVGSLMLIGVFYIIWGPLLQISKSQGANLEKVYRLSATFLTIQWVLYPLVWIIGYPGLQILDSFTTTLLFIILPIVSKAGFGFYNLIKLRSLPEEDKPTPEPPHPHEKKAGEQQYASKRT